MMPSPAMLGRLACEQGSGVCMCACACEQLYIPVLQVSAIHVNCPAVFLCTRARVRVCVRVSVSEREDRGTAVCSIVVSVHVNEFIQELCFGSRVLGPV